MCVCVCVYVYRKLNSSRNRECKSCQHFLRYVLSKFYCFVSKTCIHSFTIPFIHLIFPHFSIPPSLHPSIHSFITFFISLLFFPPFYLTIHFFNINSSILPSIHSPHPSIQLTHPFIHPTHPSIYLTTHHPSHRSVEQTAWNSALQRK